MLEPKPENINHLALMRITEDMPCKKIIVNGELYLERYFVSEDKNGVQKWLHRFLRPDAERHLHSHPWTATSTILVGWYVEEFHDKDQQPVIQRAMYSEGMVNFIYPQKLHRISSVYPSTWTEMIVQPGRRLTWEFVDESGNQTEVETSHLHWWKECKKRDGKDPKLYLNN